MPTKQEFLQEALKSAVKGTAVPALMLLKVIKNYHDSIAAHKREMTTNQAILRAQSKERKIHEEQIRRHEETLSNYDGHLKRLSQVDWTGEKGETGAAGIDGRDGIDADEERVARSVLSRIPVPQDGKDGRDGKDAEIEQVSRHVIEIVKKEQLLDLTHIKGAQGFIKDGVKYKFEELMHGGGGKSSGGGFTKLSTTAIPNGNITSFPLPAAAAKPSFVVSDGVWYEAVSESGVTNWTWSGTNVSINFPAPISSLFGVV